MSTLPPGLGLLQLAADFTELALVWLVQSTVILLAALAAGRILAGRGPALASAIYRTALVTVIVCPLASPLFSAWGDAFGLRLPAIEVIAFGDNEPAINADIVREDSPTLPAPVHGSNEHDHSFAGLLPGTIEPQRIAADAKSDDAQLAAAPWGNVETNVPLMPATNERNPLAVSRTTDIEPAEAVARIHRGVSALVVAAALSWLCISLVLITRLLAGLRQAATLVRKSVAAEVAAQRLCAELAAALGVRSPLLARTAFVESPCLVGVLRPAILLPERLPESSPGVPLEAVLVHELAHLRREPGRPLGGWRVLPSAALVAAGATNGNRRRRSLRRPRAGLRRRSHAVCQRTGRVGRTIGAAAGEGQCPFGHAAFALGPPRAQDSRLSRLADVENRSAGGVRSARARSRGRRAWWFYRPAE
jgi:hypothetical protein